MGNEILKLVIAAERFRVLPEGAGWAFQATQRWEQENAGKYKSVQS